VRDCFGVTQAGAENLANLEKMACGLITWRQNPSQMKRQMREAFERFGAPTWPVDKAIYAVPPRLAAQLGVSLVVYGENISWTYGGGGAIEQPSAMDQIRNDVVRPLDIAMDDESASALKPYDDPGLFGSVASEIEPIYLSYFVPWDGYKNYRLSQSIGFQDAEGEWSRRGFCESYDQIDSLGYCVHPLLKWIKFGACRVSDVCSNLIRCGYMSREQAVERVYALEGYMDERAQADFCEALGYDDFQFDEITHRHQNPHIFKDSAETFGGYRTLRDEFQLR